MVQDFFRISIDLRRRSKVRNKFSESADKLEGKLAQAQAYIQKIIKEQEKIIETASGRIKKINFDLKALRFRIKPYIGENPKPYDSDYYEMKDEYEELLVKRSVLARTISISEENISAAKLNLIHGQESEEKI